MKTWLAVCNVTKIYATLEKYEDYYEDYNVVMVIQSDNKSDVVDAAERMIVEIEPDFDFKKAGSKMVGICKTAGQDDILHCICNCILVTSTPYVVLKKREGVVGKIG